MRKIIGIAVILLMASGYAAAAEYWHFGAGVRLTGVMPGKDYSNALGVGVLLTFGDPDSRFTTQIDFDNWKVEYTKDGDTILYSTLQQIADGDSLYRLATHEYSGLGFGIYEKYRALDFSSALSAYVIGGFGAYFLDYLKEERNDFGTIESISYGLHSLFQLSGGLGLEAALSSHISSFVEGRFVGILNGQKQEPGSQIEREDSHLFKGLVGLRYAF